jgi:hypothetical protein
MAKELSNKDVAELAKIWADAEKNQISANQALKETAKLTKKVGESTDKVGEKIKRVTKEYNNWEDVIKDIKNEEIDVEGAVEDTVKNMASMTNELKRQALAGKITFGSMIKKQGIINKQYEKLKGLAYGIATGNTKTFSPKAAERYALELQKIDFVLSGQKVGLNTVEDAVGGVGDAFRAIGRRSPKDLKSSGEGIKELGKTFSIAGEVAAEEGKAISGSLLKGAGAALGGFSKLLTGPIGIVAMAGKALFDISMEADTFVKNANKRFAQVRGPNITTKDVKRQFREFNDLLYDTSENIKVGLKPEEVMSFVESLTAAGTHLDTLNTGFKNYRDAVFVAAKASRTLGVELPAVANMMGTMMNELRMNMDQVDNQFVEMAFDAQKAGMSTDRFWNAVENASASLAFYGVFIGSASKQMAQFSKTGVMGFKETADAVTNLTQAFSKMDFGKKMAFIQFAGIENVRKEFADLGKDFKRQVDELKGKKESLLEEKKGKEGSPEEAELSSQIEKLDDQLRNLQRQQETAEKTGRGERGFGETAADIAANIAMVSGKTLPLLQKGIMNQLGTKFDSLVNINGQNQRIFEQYLETQGVSVDLAHELIGMAKDINFGVKGGSEDIIKEVEGGNKITKDQAADLERIFKTTKKEELPTELEDYLVKSGKVSKDNARKLAMYIKYDKKGRYTAKMQELLTRKLTGEGLGNIKKAVDDLIDQSGIADGMLGDNAEVSNKTQREMKKTALDTFQKMKKLTLSNKDIADIAGSDFEWRKANIIQLAHIADVAGNILTLLGGWFKQRGYEPPATKAEEKILDKLTLLTEDSGEQTKNFATYAKGVLSATKTFNKLNDVQDILKSIDAESDPEKQTAAFSSAIEEAQKTAETTGDKTVLNKLLDAQKEFQTALQKNTEAQKGAQGDDLLKLQYQANHLLSGIIEGNDENIKGVQKGLQRDQNIVDLMKKNYKAMDANAFDFLEALKEGDKGQIADQVKSALDDAGGDLGKALKNLGDIISPSQYIFQYGAFSPLQGTGTPDVPFSGRGATQSFDNLKTSATFKSSGPVLVDRGESILSRDLTKIMAQPKGIPGIGGGKANIDVHIYAYDRDMPQKVKNAVQGAIYQWQQTGMIGGLA